MPLFTPDINVDNTPLPVDGSGVTQPVSGNVGITGSVAVTGPLTDAELRATSVPVSGPLTDAQLRATAVPVTGTFTTAGSSAATVTQHVMVANTNATLLAANPVRKGVVIFIPTASIAQSVFIKFGATASSTSFTYKATSNNSTIELPSSWLGQVDALTVTGQTITVTEF